MNADDAEVLQRLDDLMRLCREGLATFRLASQVATDPRERQASMRGVARQSRLVSDLEDESRHLDRAPAPPAKRIRVLDRGPRLEAQLAHALLLALRESHVVAEV